MKKFDLSIYKYSKPYFDLFDVYFKENSIKKEFFLLDNDITPSTYRQCRKEESNSGPKIVKSLSKKFSFKNFSNDLIDHVEALVNNIYFDMYYKNYKQYDNYLEEIDKLLEEKYIIFPILELLKIFIRLSSNNSISSIKKENELLFNRIKIYEKFLNYGLDELFEIVYLSFERDIPEDCWIKNYKNASAYFILASRSYMNRRYIETLFFASKCKEILSEDGNINRILYLNNTIMSSLIHVGNYDECYILSFKQLKTLESIDGDYKFLLNSSKKFLVLSMLGLGYYDEIIKKYENADNLLLTEILCTLIALFEKGTINKDFSKYNSYYASWEVDKLESDDSNIIILLDQFLNTKRKSILNLLLEFEIIRHFKKILEKIVEK